ncbi:response regulator transcription factor [Candidatus Gracilibacteria bacterium]|nr:response regulator transcription factor [Candidatus Gracilibacteria bacterium]
MMPLVNVSIVSIGGKLDEFVQTALREQGYRIVLPEAAKDSAFAEADLLLLTLATAQELTYIREARDCFGGPLIVIGPSRDSQLLITALEAGADDYVQRPFRTDELLARIRAQLRRRTNGVNVRQIGELRIDAMQQRVMYASHELHLSRVEYQLLVTLLNHPGRRLQAGYLIEQVWGQHTVDDLEVLQATIHRLRGLVERDIANPQLLCGDVRQGYWIKTAA